MKLRSLILAVAAITGGLSANAADPLPFNVKTEVYREKEGDVVVFALRLEQPFLAEEFEKSNYLRLKPLDRNAYLIYPRETKFRQKHAEFYGRLRGKGKVKLRLSYEIVSENLDGSRKVDERQAEIEVTIPEKPTGIENLYKDWARKQNDHFAELLRYYPDETFFEYVLLQSRYRYGITPPPLPKRIGTGRDTETQLYHLFSGGLAVQQDLQRQTLTTGPQVGDLTIHVSELKPPAIASLDYEELLKEKQKLGVQPKVREIAKLVPEDHYFLHFNSMSAANELMDLSTDWGESLLRLFTVNAREHHLREKYELQLCLERDALTQLFDDGVISELAITGSDFFVAEGTDLTILFGLKKADLFKKAADDWLAAVKQNHPELIEREFNYRGHKVLARYSTDRTVSSFVVYKGDYAVFSTSHVAIRKVVDTIIGKSPSLHDAIDYRYVSTILPPNNDANSGYLYASDAFLRRLVSPQFKIAEKRRLQAFNNLVMLNNASLFYRLEYGKSPGSLNDLVEGKFVDLKKVGGPYAGSYAFDATRDTATSSLFNRIKYLTPIVELNVQKVSSRERQEYDRYRQRYEAFWKKMFDPLAVRMTVGETVTLETCVLPFANSSFYTDLRSFLDDKPQRLGTADIARSAVNSIMLVPGREKTAAFLRAIPGVTEVLAADPTLTDLSWLGDGVSLHFLDDDTILEIDPTRLKTLSMLGNVSVMQQTLLSAAIAATNLPIYLTIDVENEEKASRLLENLSSKIFLKGDNLLGLQTKLDSYRMPDYKKHEIYVLSYQLYAIKVRMYVALVKGKLVAATKPHALQQVIDAAGNKEPAPPREGHAMLRINFAAMDKLKDDVETYWSEKLRQACHRNIMPIYNLIKLYEVRVDEANALADSKYGVTFFCPGGGEYKYDAEKDQVYSTVFGNRRNARQPAKIDDDSAFSRFFNGLTEIRTTLLFRDDALIGTIEIQRRKKQPE